LIILLYPLFFKEITILREKEELWMGIK